MTGYTLVIYTFCICWVNWILC